MDIYSICDIYCTKVCLNWDVNCNCIQISQKMIAEYLETDELLSNTFSEISTYITSLNTNYIKMQTSPYDISTVKSTHDFTISINDTPRKFKVSMSYLGGMCPEFSIIFFLFKLVNSLNNFRLIFPDFPANVVEKEDLNYYRILLTRKT